MSIFKAAGRAINAVLSKVETNAVADAETEKTIRLVEQHQRLNSALDKAVVNSTDRQTKLQAWLADGDDQRRSIHSAETARIHAFLASKGVTIQGTTIAAPTPAPAPDASVASSVFAD